MTHERSPRGLTLNLNSDPLQSLELSSEEDEVGCYVLVPVHPCKNFFKSISYPCLCFFSLFLFCVYFKPMEYFWKQTQRSWRPLWRPDAHCSFCSMFFKYFNSLWRCIFIHIFSAFSELSALFKIVCVLIPIFCLTFHHISHRRCFRITALIPMCVQESHSGLSEALLGWSTLSVYFLGLWND